MGLNTNATAHSVAEIQYMQLKICHAVYEFVRHFPFLYLKGEIKKKEADEKRGRRESDR